MHPGASYGVAVNEKDTEDYRHLLSVLDRIDPWLSRIDHETEPARPQTGSPMQGDDNRLHPYQISHAGWGSLSNAVDHLHCLRAVLRDAAIVHMYAPYTLLRAAFENACAAVWLLQPPLRAERVARRLRLAMNDIHHGEAAKTISHQAGLHTRAERVGEIRRIASECAVDQKAASSRIDYRTIIEDVGDPDRYMFLLWSVCSGIAHGDFWARRAATTMVERPGSSSPELAAFKVSASVGLLEQFTTITVGMTNRGWNLYDQRSRSPWQPIT